MWKLVVNVTIKQVFPAMYQHPGNVAQTLRRGSSMNTVTPPPLSGKSPPEFLQFCVAHQMWKISISPTPLREHGKAAMTLRIPSTREIRISPDVVAGKRLRVLVTAIRQCWDMSGVDFRESQIDNGGIDIETISLALAEDLSRQGGEKVLQFMKPPGKNQAPAPALPPKMPDVFPAGSEKALQRWNDIGRELASNKDIELTLEVFAPICATFAQLKNAGYHFDQTVTQLMAILKRQGFSNDGESDYDYRGYDRVRGLEIFPMA